MARTLEKRDAERDLNLYPGERVIAVMRRHPVHLLIRLALPLAFLILTGGLALFRSAGGRFFVPNAAIEGQFGGFDFVLLTALTLILISAWVLRYRRAILAGLVLFDLLLVAWLFFRLRGGRLIAVDPFASQSLDTLGLGLLILASLAGAFCVYIYLDWKIDEFVLTSHRVVYNNERPLVRRTQEQLPLSDIQKVEASTESYLQHWFNYGTLRIRSAVFGHQIAFYAADQPQSMQERIMAQVKRARREENDAELRQLIEETIFGQPREHKERRPEIGRSQTPYLLGWLFSENPEYDPERDTYTWHPHWFVLVKMLLAPAGALLLALVLLAFAAAIGMLQGPLLVVTILITFVVIGLWAAWQIEDYRNEHYVLSPTEVTDRTKKPLGPETCRTANLDALQNVTYRTTLIGRLFGYGDVILTTAGSGEDFTFHAAPRPSEMTDVITSYQVAFRKSRKRRSLEDTVKLIEYYHRARRQEAA